MNEYIYLKSTINPNYTQKVRRQDYLANPNKFAYMIPLTGEAERAEQIYDTKVRQNEWKFRGLSLAQGFTAGLSDLGLSSEDKELLAKYKQRSSLGNALDFIGSVGSYAATAAVTGGAGLPARVGLGVTRAVRSAKIGRAAAVGTRIGVEGARIGAYAGTRRLAERVGQGKPVSIPLGLEVYGTEFVKGALFSGGFSLGGAALGMTGKTAGKGISKAASLAGITRKGAKQVDKEFATGVWGVKPQKVRIGAEDVLESQVKKESDSILKNLASKKDPKKITLNDLQKAVENRLGTTGKSLGRILEKADRGFFKNLTPQMLKHVESNFIKTLEKIEKHLKLTGVATGDVKKIVKAFRQNMFIYRKNKNGEWVRTLRQGVFNNLRTTRQFAQGFVEKAKGAKIKQKEGILKKVASDLDELEVQTLNMASKGLSGIDKSIKQKYATLSAMRRGITDKISKASPEHTAPAAFRDIARGALLFGTPAGFFGGGVAPFLIGSLVGGTISHIARRGQFSPWKMSIYPDIASQANRFLSGGKLVPEVLINQVKQGINNRFHILQRLSNGVKQSPEAREATKMQFFRYINENMNDDEKRDVYMHIRNAGRNIISDPQKLNQVAFGSSEILSQGGGSAFGPQVQMGTMDALKKFVDSFPKDRSLSRPDDLMEQKNMWSKRDLQKIGKRMEVFFEPDGIVQDIIDGAGDITLDQVQYLKFMYPEYFGAVRNALIMGLNNGTLKLKPKERTRLSYLFKLPIKISTHPKMMNISEQIGNLNLARHAGQKEQVRKNLNVERKADSLKTAAERSLLNEDQA